MENFPVSGVSFPPIFIHALGLVKYAAASANEALGLLDPQITTLIRNAAREVIAGEHDHEFVVDIFQTGSGTSINTNANEVIANRASAARLSGPASIPTRSFAAQAIKIIAAETGLPFPEPENHFEAQAARDACVHISGALKTLAVSLIKIANEIRWLASGPRCAIGEIGLPGYAARFVDHAGQSQSGSLRISYPSCGSCHRL